MKKNNSRCLLLNADFTPLSIIPWKRAVVWHMKYENTASYGIDIIDFYKDDFIVGTNNKKYPIPAVARTKRFFRQSHQTLIFSRKNIFLRDNYTCQYCGIQYEINNLTYDHVIPRSVWSNTKMSPTCWTNIVTACIKCNLKKSNKTPAQANMPLKREPFIPQKSLKYLPLSYQLNTILKDFPQQWYAYIGDLIG